MHKTPVGNLIKQSRLIKGLTIKEIGATIGVSRQQVYNFESGRSPVPVKYLLKLSLAFGVQLKTLATANFQSTAAYRKFAAKSRRIAYVKEDNRITGSRYPA